MSQIRIGIVGAGHLGRIHTRLIKNVPTARLTCIAEPQPLLQQQMLDEYNCLVVSDYRKIADEVDAVIIATPTTTHHEVATFFLERGIHTLIEKPMTQCAEQAAELVQLAKEHDATVQIGHVEHFNPAVQKALEYVGQPKFIEASRCSGYTFRSTDIGVVHDLMIHDIELINWMFGSPVVDSKSVGMSVMGGNEDIARSWLQFECGGVANLTASRCSFEAERRMQIFGTDGFASIDLTTSTLKAIRIPSWVRQREFSFQGCSADQIEFVKANLFSQVLPVEEVTVEPANAIQLEQLDWIEAILENRRPTICAETGLRAVQVAERILDQIDEHSWAQNDRSMTGPFAVPPINQPSNDNIPSELKQVASEAKRRAA
ncbi:Gfo/Idh/MocA family oxidoreductase [bacterium]|nr:Gfo/Idh/MocA family oxidoreductase [bacterium]